MTVEAGNQVSKKNLNLGMRLLIGFLGAISFALGSFVAATELREAYLGSPLLPTLLAAVVCGIVAIGGAVLLRGAWVGRITVRPTRYPNRPR